MVDDREAPRRTKITDHLKEKHFKNAFRCRSFRGALSEAEADELGFDETDSLDSEKQ